MQLPKANTLTRPIVAQPLSDNNLSSEVTASTPESRAGHARLSIQSRRFIRLPSIRSRIARAASSTFVPGPNMAATPAWNSSS